jgi:two-component system, NarL family, sensor histidine kinase DesK
MKENSTANVLHDVAGTRPSRRDRWFASFWLIYLAFVFVEPWMARQPLTSWLVATGTVAVFLPLYLGSWTSPRHPRLRYVFMMAMALLGLAVVPFNVGGSTYVIFSAAVAGFVLGRPRYAIAYVLAIALILLGVTVLSREPFEYWMALQPVIVVVIGLGNVVAAEERRRNVFVRRAQEEVEEMAKLAERERIARDLHDVLGHTLSVIALKSELAARLSTIDPARAVEEIREVERVSRTALSQVRAAVEGYRGHGLRGELKSAADALGAAGVALAADVEPVMLPPKQETVLALAMREAVTNVVRHAHATACRISLKAHEGRVVLRVEDNGVGGVPSEGNGLAGMRERVAAVGGTVTVDGGGGLHLTVTVP